MLNLSLLIPTCDFLRTGYRGSPNYLARTRHDDLTVGGIIKPKGGKLMNDLGQVITRLSATWIVGVFFVLFLVNWDGFGPFLSSPLFLVPAGWLLLAASLSKGAAR